MRSTERGPSTGRIRLGVLLAAVGALMLVPAAQAFGLGTMHVKIIGSGSGEVIGGEHSTLSGNPKVECSYTSPGPTTGVCDSEMSQNEGAGPGLVDLAAKAAPNSEFAGWVVAEEEFPHVHLGCESEPGFCYAGSLEDVDDTVTAIFECVEECGPSTFPLSIETTGTGNGEVECEVDEGLAEPCEAEYEEGTEVALVPEAETGSEFVQWSEDCTGSGACELTMDEAHSVTATFDEEEEPEPEEFNLTIVKAGTGSGSVTCNAGACAATYEEGEELTLAATAASGSTFSGWSGGGCSGTGSCVVTIEEDTTVTATFTANPTPPAPTCATDPSLCPPPPPVVVEGKAKAAGTATVKSGKASLKLTCTGGPCKGTVQLTAKVKQGKKTKNLVIGKASFSIAEGATATLKVKLSGPAKQELAKGKTLKAKTSGSGVTASTVKLKQAKKS